MQGAIGQLSHIKIFFENFLAILVIEPGADGRGEKTLPLGFAILSKIRVFSN